MAMALKEGNTAMPIGDIGEGEGLEAVSYSQVFQRVYKYFIGCSILAD